MTATDRHERWQRTLLTAAIVLVATAVACGLVVAWWVLTVDVSGR